MGAILAAVIVMAVMGSSLSLLHSHLEGVDEYNRRAAEVADAHRRAVHESVGVSADGAGGGAYTVKMSNERADPVEIIEVRSVLEDGTIASLPEFGGPISLAGFGEASVPYDVPEGATGGVSILAVTRMGNTFGAEIGLHGEEPDAARATINGMGIGSRLAQAEYSGHVTYGSGTWSSMDSIKPHVAVEGGDPGDPPSFAALLLDSDAETVVAVSGYGVGTLVTVGADGTLSSADKPSILSLAESRGTAAASADAGVITIDGPGQAMVRLDPAMLGKRVFLNATLGGGRVELLTSPYGSLATPIDVTQARAMCPGLVWLTEIRSPNPAYSRVAVSNGWIMDLGRLGAYVIHSGTAPALELASHTTSFSKSGTPEERGAHHRYWHIVHYTPNSRTTHYGQGWDQHAKLSDHSYYTLRNNMFMFGLHHGEFSAQYNSTQLQMPDPGLLLRDGSRVHVAYAPALVSTMAMSQATPPPSTFHLVNDGTPVTIKKSWTGVIRSGLFSAHSHWKTNHYPNFSVSAGSEPHFVARSVGASQYGGGDSFYGIPLMSFRGGGAGNADYASLAGITFNAIHPAPTVYKHVPYDYATGKRAHTAPSKIAWDGKFCVIAERPYVSELTFTSDAVATEVVTPERDRYARHAYLLVTARASPVTLSAVSEDAIAGLAPSVPYVMEHDGQALHSGVTSERGTIPFVGGLPASFTLRLYPDSASYRGAFSTIVFDPRAGESMRVAGDGDRVYTVHTWAQVPVTGTVTVSDVEVRTRDGTGLRLDYLDGEYSAGAGDGGRIWVPVIPGHFSIHMRVNGVDAALRYSDALGGSNVRVIPASTSTVSRASFDAPINSIGASAGTSAYAIASSDLPIVAIVSSTMSGTAHIEHEHVARTVRTCMRDPLTGWVTAHKNGELVYESRRIIDYNPAITRSSTVNGDGLGVTRAEFEYGRVAIDETVVVDGVSVGDFVEFHVHANIYAEHAFSTVEQRTWCGWRTNAVHVSSEASATANIHGGSIIVG